MFIQITVSALCVLLSVCVCDLFDREKAAVKLQTTINQKKAF